MQHLGAPALPWMRLCSWSRVMKNDQGRKTSLPFFIPQPLNTAFVFLIVSALFFQIKWNLSLKIMIILCQLATVQKIRQGKPMFYFFFCCQSKAGFSLHKSCRCHGSCCVDVLLGPLGSGLLMYEHPQLWTPVSSCVRCEL